MRKNEALKLAAGILSTALFLSMPSAIAKADSFISSEQGIAGISAILDNTTNQELEDAYNASVDSDKVKEEKKEKALYENLAVSIADDYVNIRKSASTESAIVGRLYRGCAANILKKLDGGWVKIKSGKVEGYIASQFLVIGEKAKPMVDKYATKYATVVGTKSLRVRDKKSTEAQTLTLIPLGETYVVNKEYGKWAKILLGDDDSRNEEYTGYVSKDYVKIKVKLKYAMTMKEIQRQEEAIRAEKERKEKRAQEEAERKEAQRRAANASKSTSRSNGSSSSRGSSSSGGSSSGSSSHSSLRSQVVNYALKFVGNPYVWGGQSLTRGADCSGFVRAVYSDFGYNLPRTSRDQAASAGRRVSESNLQPGDLIFYASSSGRVNHVAMYIGNGKIVHAATSRQGIIVSQYKYRSIYCVKRIIN